MRASAFDFRVDEPADWLTCDMAWRPLEVAALLAKLGRQGAARFLVANIKLPMKKKVEMIRRVRDILATGGWRDVRVRQLYHDRDEVTLGAWRLGK
jgi:23S rRNA (cytidine2498-2'-O)-methyltransferase